MVTASPTIPMRDGGACRGGTDGTRWRGRGGCGKGSGMNRPSQSPKAGGMPIALGTLGGAIIGAMFGEATIGLLVGLALGIGIAVIIWRRDRV